jgi:hypothetical protein
MSGTSLSELLNDLDGHGIILDDEQLAQAGFSDTSLDGVDDLIELLDSLDGEGIILTDPDLVERFANRHFLFPMVVMEH